MTSRFRYIGQRDHVWSQGPRPLSVVCPDLHVKHPPCPEADYIPGAPWWSALSVLSVRDLARLFDQQDVACILYEVIGAIEPRGEKRVVVYGRPWYPIWIQVSRNDWTVDLGLEEAGVVLETLFVG